VDFNFWSFVFTAIPSSAVVGALIRPRLHLRTLPPDPSFNDHVSTVALPTFRLAVENYSLTAARNVQVMLDSVTALEGDAEHPMISFPSPLLWTDSASSEPRTIPRRKTLRAELCFTDPKRPLELFFRSLDGQKFIGGFRPGLYRIEISAHADFASSGALTIYLAHGGTDEWHSFLYDAGMGTEVILQLPQTKWRL
jgi:hypothetical protein